MPDMTAVMRAVDDELPGIARLVIESHLDLSDPRNEMFLRNPDDRSQHQAQWHQWGIISHTREFLRQFDADVRCYLRAWGVLAQVDELLDQRIDGATKRDLLRISILLHDIGKFAARFVGRRGEFHFTHHERLSGEIIRSQLNLPRFGLTPAQVAYVATTAEDHFVLGLVRKRAREQGAYDVEFARGRRFRELALQIKTEHPDDYVEIGVLFLGDSLAKANPESGPELAVGQYDVNIAVAHQYLALVLGGAE